MGHGTERVNVSQYVIGISDVEANEWERVLSAECLRGPPSVSDVDLLESGPQQRELLGTVIHFLELYIFYS